MYPVITIVLYFGKKTWNYPLSALENIAFPEILRPFANDVRLNLVDIHRISNESIENFRGDFRLALHLLRDDGYEPKEDDIILHTDAFLKFLGALTKKEIYDEARKSLGTKEHGEEGIKMTTLIDRVYGNGKLDGKIEGEARGEGKLAKLIGFLLNEGNIADIRLATEDEEIRKEMYKKYGIVD